MTVILPKLYLASSSLRRQQLLDQIQMPYTTLSVDVDEAHKRNESPRQLVKRLALEKAQAGWRVTQRVLDIPVLGADTIVVLGKRIFGKPKDRKDGIQMLTSLSGNTHRVYSAVAVVFHQTKHVTVSVSTVTFKSLTLREIENYWDKTDEPYDKAGSYSVQGIGAIFIKKISGSYSGIMGLPLTETVELLQSDDVGMKEFF